MMIDYIKGSLVECGPGWIVLENQGMGYRLEVPASADYHRWEGGEKVTVYTRLVLKEDALSLYGFLSSEERNLFNLIVGVGGFGPRIALSILGGFTVSQFYVAVLEENTDALSGIPGIGRKSSQRLILELKEKLPASFSHILEGEVAGVSGSGAGSGEKETIEALSSLGFSTGEARAAVEHAKTLLQGKGKPEELLKAALKYLSYR